jgi:hypothetical protein
MGYKLYDNTIIAPLKCGTRYLDKIFDDSKKEELNMYTIFDLSKFRSSKYYFLYREPYEWLVTALHTEIVNGRIDDIGSIIELFTNPFGSTHWRPNILKNLYLRFMSNNPHQSINAINLINLTECLRNIGYTPPTFDANEYKFYHLKHWVSKEDIIDIIKKDYPNEWDYLMDCIKSEQHYYALIESKTPIPLKLI